MYLELRLGHWHWWIKVYLDLHILQWYYWHHCCNTQRHTCCNYIIQAGITLTYFIYFPFNVSSFFLFLKTCISLNWHDAFVIFSSKSSCFKDRMGSIVEARCLCNILRILCLSPDSWQILSITFYEPFWAFLVSLSHFAWDSTILTFGFLTK